MALDEKLLAFMMTRALVEQVDVEPLDDSTWIRIKCDTPINIVQLGENLLYQLQWWLKNGVTINEPG